MDQKTEKLVALQEELSNKVVFFILLLFFFKGSRLQTFMKGSNFMSICEILKVKSHI